MATVFADCLFTDDTALSPTGHLYFSGGAKGPVVDFNASDNILFNRCRFELQRAGVLPWTTHAIFRDCMMEQHSHQVAMTKGRYLGHNVIKGPVDLYGSMIVGQVYLNGRLIPRGAFGSGFVPW